MEVFSYHKGEGGSPPMELGGPEGLRGPPKEPQGLHMHPQNRGGPCDLHVPLQSGGDLGNFLGWWPA